MNPDGLLEHLDGLSREPLAFTPTPLLPAPRLREALGPDAPSILLKMDAWTGFGLGGNKVRKLEYVLGARDPEVDTLLTTGGVQSNHARVTAAAAARMGLRCILVLDGTAPQEPRGNALLHRLLGAEIRMVATREERPAALEAAAAEVQAAGGRPLVIPLGASTPRGALGYVRAAVELHTQLAALPGPPPGRTWIFLSSSSCGTLAGLALGFALLEAEGIRLVGVSADVPEAEILARTREIAEGAAALLEAVPPLPPHRLVSASDAQVGEGYGIPTAASREALELTARTTGVILDPVYTSKAMAGLLDHVRAGRIGRDDRVVFLHTGGHPALFS